MSLNFRDKSFDDWKARGPHEDMPNTAPVSKRETCEVCGSRWVPAVSVARCGDHFSYWPSRPERRGGK
jgi:hypothetical protein